MEGDVSGVERAHAGPNHHVEADIQLHESSNEADFHGAEATAAAKHQGGPFSRHAPRPSVACK